MISKGEQTHTRVQEFHEHDSSFAKPKANSRQILTPATVAGFGIVIILLAFTPQYAAAQQDEVAAYRDLIVEALKEYKLGNWEESRTLFKKAHELNPNARTLRGLGKASFEARRYVEAFVAFQGSLDATRKPLTQQQRTEVTELIERTEQFIGRRALRRYPGSAVITIDGKEAVMREGFLLLNPGQHEIIAKAEGYTTAIRQITIDGGSTAGREESRRAKSAATARRTPMLRRTLRAVMKRATKRM